MSSLAERVRALGLALGFERVGFGPAAPAPRNAFLREWIARGYAGEMTYLARRVEERIDPRRLVPGACSLIAVALRYAPAEAREESGAADCRIARYAGGDDYHEVLRERLDAFESGIEALAAAPIALRSYVDTGPVLERPAAARAGLGWIGKHTLLIDRALGSYFFLGIVITDLALPADAEEPDHCGTCRACLDACPTDAFPEPYVLDATRCLSYTTIELRGAIPEALRGPQRDWVFGCDVCQEVCPWNARAARSPEPASAAGAALRAQFAPRPALEAATLAWLLALDEDAWRAVTRRTALRRAKYRGLLRNALVAAGNRGCAELREAVARHAASADAGVAEHARWALARIDAAAAAPSAGA
ncbi:MAG: tRNA epoxyqueuosine(34) reductase QueG [Myxococcota bacterium]